MTFFGTLDRLGGEIKGVESVGALEAMLARQSYCSNELLTLPNLQRVGVSKSYHGPSEGDGRVELQVSGALEKFRHFVISYWPAFGCWLASAGALVGKAGSVR